MGASRSTARCSRRPWRRRKRRSNPRTTEPIVRDRRFVRGAGQGRRPGVASSKRLACCQPGCFSLSSMAGEASPHIFLAFTAGLLSVLSPCVLPLMPAYLSLISGLSVDEMRDGRSDSGLRRRVMSACFGFVAGFSLVSVLLGIGADAVARVVRTWRLDLFGVEIGISQLAGVVILVLGLHMAGITPIRALYRDTRLQIPITRRGALSAGLVGAGFALGWSPCIGPILAAILTLAGARETVLHGMVLLLVYSAGLAVPFLLAGWSIERFLEATASVRRHFRALEIGSGLVLVGVGFLLVINRFTALNGPLAFMNDFIAAAERALQ